MLGLIDENERDDENGSYPLSIVWPTATDPPSPHAVSALCHVCVTYCHPQVLVSNVAVAERRKRYRENEATVSSTKVCKRIHHETKGQASSHVKSRKRVIECAAVGERPERHKLLRTSDIVLDSECAGDLHAFSVPAPDLGAELSLSRVYVIRGFGSVGDVWW